jgi:hypothetical protein
MGISDNTIARKGFEALAEALPPAWKLKTAPPSEQRGPQPDLLVQITEPDGKKASLIFEVKQQLQPRQVPQLAEQLRQFQQPNLVVSPYLSPAVCERLVEAGLNYLDLTGNAWLALRKPGLFIRTQGASVDPNPKTRPSRSLRGDKAGRIVRALIGSKTPPGVRELAERTDIDAGYVSRVLSLLDKEALVERDQGRLSRVDWPRLLRRWAEEVPLDSRGVQTLCLEPRGFADLKKKLRESELTYALTGTLAIQNTAPIAPARLAVVYVADAERVLKELMLRRQDAGANVMLIEPSDFSLFTEAIKLDGDLCVPLAQAAADLLTSPGRGPAEAEELITWMTEHEGVWRG